MADLGKWLIVAGAMLVVLGVVALAAGRIPGFGKLPGNIVVERKHFTFYFPVVTCLLLSVLATLIMWIVSRFR